MTTVIDETMLTAYALGELSGTERAAVAAHLAGHPDARLYVADVRSAANLLSDELARESFGGMTDVQHAVIEQKLGEMLQVPAVRISRRRKSYWDQAVFAMSLAASIAIVLGGMALLAPFIYQHVETAFQSNGPAKPAPLVPASKPTFNPTTELPKAPQVPPDVQPAPQIASPDHYATDVNEPGDQAIPQPDSVLADRGSGREESPLIPLHPADDLKPARHVPVARGPTIPGIDETASRPPEIARPPADAFANLPVDQPSSDKNKATAPKTGGGPIPNGGRFAHLVENPFIDVAKESLSGFSAGVDTASYSNIRRFLTHGQLPPHDAVRIEEMLNYFPARQAPGVTSGDPLSLEVEIGTCPWRPEHRLVRVCVRANELPAHVPVNLVFVIDASEQMRKDPSKLPLMIEAMQMLAGRLSPQDQISILAYTRETAVVLPTTPGDDKTAIRSALKHLESGVQMTGGQGIVAAYDIASRSMVANGVNRLVLISDGNWNVGATDHNRLASLIRARADTHVSVTVLGVGMTNIFDATLQNLAAAGNGTYAYIDTLAEARKVLVDQVEGALVARATDVKVSVEFTPAAQSYRLLGYERRALSKEEVKSHSRAGGDMGAGQTVTALYEVEVSPERKSSNQPAKMVTATVNYFDPAALAPRTVDAVGMDKALAVPQTSGEFRFAAAVAEFGLLLRNSDYKGSASYANVIKYLEETSGGEDFGYRRECLKLARKAYELSVSRTK